MTNEEKIMAVEVHEWLRNNPNRGTKNMRNFITKLVYQSTLVLTPSQQCWLKDLHNGYIMKQDWPIFYGKSPMAEINDDLRDNTIRILIENQRKETMAAVRLYHRVEALELTVASQNERIIELENKNG